MNLENPDQAIWQELDAATKEYGEAKNLFDGARIRFEVAKRRLEATKQLASEVIPQAVWENWLSSHRPVKYAGASIGEAAVDYILSATHDFYENATDSQFDHRPLFRLDDIRQGLVRGGFEFRTLTPNRELHASLIKQTEVKKEYDYYVAMNAAEIAAKVAEQRKME